MSVMQCVSVSRSCVVNCFIIMNFFDPLTLSIASVHLLKITTYGVRLDLFFFSPQIKNKWTCRSGQTDREAKEKENTHIPAQHQQLAHSQLGAISFNSACQSVDLEFSLGPREPPPPRPISPEAHPYIMQVDRKTKWLFIFLKKIGNLVFKHHFYVNFHTFCLRRSTSAFGCRWASLSPLSSCRLPMFITYCHNSADLFAFATFNFYRSWEIWADVKLCHQHLGSSACCEVHLAPSLQVPVKTWNRWGEICPMKSDFA